MPRCPAPPASPPRAELTSLSPQGQFLCLALKEGRLLLLYNFGSGLREAIPMQPPPPLTAASKAVGRGWGGPPGAGGRGSTALPEAPAPAPSRSRCSCCRATESACWCAWRGPRYSAWRRTTCWSWPMPTTWGGCRPPSYPRGGNAGRAAGGGLGWRGGAAALTPGPPQPTAALPLWRLGARLRQGHQSPGQVRGPQEAEHDGHQLWLHRRPAGG